MEKIIYHGSDHIITQPRFGVGKPYNDYGVGFYCTEDPDMAKEWGVGLDRNGYANRYRISCDGLPGPHHAPLADHSVGEPGV